MSHHDKAVLRVTKQIEAGRILKAYNALDHEDTTVGPYHTAVDTGTRFAVIGWVRLVGVGSGTCAQRESRSARDAALAFVSRVGTTRAREAALKAEKTVI